MAIESMVAKHSTNLTAERYKHARHDFQARQPIAVSAPAIITRKHTKIIGKVVREFSGSLHGEAA